MSLPRDGISANPIFWGAYAQASWWVTGEHRRYLRGRGVFSRVVPNHRFNLEQSHLGAFELLFEGVDLSKVPVALESGATDFITKPYRPEEVIARQHVAERLVQATSARSSLKEALHEAASSKAGARRDTLR